MRKLKACLNGIFILTSLIAPGTVLAMPNPTPGGVLWGNPNGLAGGTSLYTDIGIWGDASSGAAKAFSIGPNSGGVSNAAIVGFGNFGGKYRYILREQSGLGRILWTDTTTPLASPAQIQTLADQTWKIGAVGDLNKDGVADIIWRNSNGTNAVWLLNSSGGLVVPSFAIDPLVDSNWEIKGLADFNADGNQDLLWYHKTNGAVVAWYLNSSYATASSAVLTTLPNATWDIKPDAAGDFDGDGDGDFLAQNKSNNTAVIYKMQGGAIQPGLTLAGQANITATTPPARNFAPLLMLDGAVNSADITSSGGSNPLAMGDLGTLNSTSRLTVPSRNTGFGGAFDSRYKFQVSGSSVTLAIGVDNPWFRVSMTNLDGTNIGGTSSEAGGFTVQTVSPGTYYLRVAAASSAPSNLDSANYNLLINPAVAPPVLVADFDAGAENVGGGEGIGQGVTLNGWTYFPATTATTGRELYRTKGVTTQLVSDIVSGVISSNPDDLVVAGGFVYFVATTETNGRKLWRTDGTTTAIVGHVNATTVSDRITNLAATTAGDVFFAATNPNGSISLRRVNGSTLTEVKNFGVNGYIAEMTALGNAIYLSASDRSGSSNIGLEPWRATTAGAVLLGDINPGVGKSSNPYEFVQLPNGDLYFAADTASTGYELFKSTGGTSAPTLVKEIGAGATGSNLTSLKALGGELFFAAFDGASVKSYRSDGTNAGTVLDQYLNQSFSTYNPYSTNSSLNYQDYLQFMPVSSAAGNSIYTVSRYGQRDVFKVSSNGLCGPTGAATKGREISVSFSSGVSPHAGATRPTAFGPSTSTPGGSDLLRHAQSALSVSYDSVCNGSSGGTYEPYSHANYDSRLVGHEDVILGNAGGIVYIAGWKSNRYEVWSMPHSESLTTRYTPDGGVAPRNLTFVGSYPNIKRGTLEFQPIGGQMLMKGYDTVAARQRMWKP
jgi:ELWxxDGT repeat protein